MRLRFALPYLALVAVHLLSSRDLEQPVILADELGYLGNARYLAGVDEMPTMRQSQFYHFGYSLFLVPVFWLFDEPGSVYRACLVVNALLASALWFPLRSLLRLVPGASPGLSSWIAFACCLHPALLVHSSFAWSESAYIPLYAASAALLARLLRTRASADAVIFGACAAFLYAVHPRALPVTAGAAGFLALLAVWKALPLRALAASGAVMATLVAVTRTANAHLKALGWAGGGELSATKLAGRLVPGGGDFELLIERALGQVVYLTDSTYGLFLVGVAVAIGASARKLSSEGPGRALAHPSTGTSLFVLGTGAGVFLASCTAKLYSIHGPDGLRGADFVHGRYNEAFAIIVVAIALAALSRGDLSRRSAGVTLVAAAAVTLAMTGLVASEVEDAKRRQDPGATAEELAQPIPDTAVSVAAVPGLFPLVRTLGGLRLYPMGLVTVVGLALLLAAARLSAGLPAALLAAAFAAFAVYNHHHFIEPTHRKAFPRLAFVEHIRGVGPLEVLAYDTHHFVPTVFFGAQYLLPGTRFLPFDSHRRERPPADVVVSGNTWRQAERMNARFVVSSGWDNALWLLPGARADVSMTELDGTVFGVEPRVGIQETGFLLPELYRGRPGRWTDGEAALEVPVDPGDPPKVLGLETVAPGRDGAELRVVANGFELWRGRVPATTWTKTVGLESVPLDDELRIELLSDVRDGRRRRGVMVRGLRLFTERGLDAAYEGALFGPAPVVGFEESGFHEPEIVDGAPGRWTTGRATLLVPFGPTRPPRTMTVELLAPGRAKASVRILVNDVELYRGEISAGGETLRFELDAVPKDAPLRLALESDTFRPSDRAGGSPDTRELGVVVRAIRLEGR